MIPNAQTITLETSMEAIHKYNTGTYGCSSNVDLDRQALDRFRYGLGRTQEDILKQIVLSPP